MIRSGKKYIFLFLCVLGLSAHSELSAPQTRNILTESAIFVNPSTNIIQGNVSMLDPLFRSLEMLEREKSDAQSVAILHLGDSHIQAGTLADAIRRPLQDDFGDAGPGLITPLRITGTNEPPNYILTSPNRWTGSKCAMMNPPFSVGIGGIGIKTDDRNIEFTISSPGEKFNLIRAFHNSEAPLLQPQEELYTGIDCPIYDTHLSTSIPLNDEVDSIVLRAAADNKGSVFYGFSLENGRRGVLYHAVGINGNNYEFTNRSPQIIKQSSLLAPNIIIISLGTNDSFGNFRADHTYTQICNLLNSVKKANPDTPILLTTPMECYTLSTPSTRSRARINKNLPLVRECIIRAAEEYDLPYWDFYAIAGGEGAMEAWLEANLANPDRIHLLKDGYMIQGELLYSALKEAYLTYLTK